MNVSAQDKPLPEPPHTPFGRKRKFKGDEQEAPLMADRMAMAMAEGKLEEFLQKEMPDNEQARKLAEMMMGMTGMMPAGGFSGTPSPAKDTASQDTGPMKPGERPSERHPPEDVVHAVKAGDVSALVEMLQREHKRRSPDSGSETVQEGKREEKKDSPRHSMASVEKEIVDQMMTIASDNNLSLDWIFFRALKRYVDEYRKTGNL